MKVGGICGNCNKYYNGPACGNPDCFVGNPQNTLQVILDVPDHYNRGLGTWINGGRSQYRAELKSRGLTEVGNERRYVSPEMNEKLQERKEKALYADLRERAYQMLNRGDQGWN